MPYYPEDAGDYENEKSETPMERMYREQDKLEAHISAQADKLLRSITPADNCPLFTFKEIRQWGLKHTRKRSVTEEDGS